ncbi:MAG: P-II family nitrogen regulator [Candidatus Lokiarchaeota archaeon]|nr:P-II family nitrogen regulator [Candidatus Lokiarchaeota archaeon]
MKKIETIIRNDRLNFVKNGLAEKGLTALTVYEVKGRGHQSGIVQVFEGKKIYADLLPKTKIEIIINDSDVESVVSTILENARTGSIGDGKIFISSIDEAIRIRTGEKGSEAV